MELEERIKLIKQSIESPEAREQETFRPANKPANKKINENSPIIKRLREDEERARLRNLSDDELIEREFADEAEAKRAHLADNIENVKEYIEQNQTPQSRNLSADSALDSANDFSAESKSEFAVEINEIPKRVPLPKRDFAQETQIEKTQIAETQIAESSAKSNVDSANFVRDSALQNRGNPNLEYSPSTAEDSRKMSPSLAEDSRKMSPSLAEGDLGGGFNSPKDSANFVDSAMENAMDSAKIHDFASQSTPLRTLYSTQNPVPKVDLSNLHIAESEPQNFAESVKIAESAPKNTDFKFAHSTAPNATPNIISNLAQSNNEIIYTPNADYTQNFDDGRTHSIEIVDKIDNYDIEFPKIKALYDDILGDNNIIDATEDIDELNEINNSLTRAQKKLEERLKIAKMRQNLGDIKSITPIKSNADFERDLAQNVTETQNLGQNVVETQNLGQNVVETQNLNISQNLGQNFAEINAESAVDSAEKSSLYLAENTPPQTPPARGGAFSMSPSRAEGDLGGGFNAPKDSAIFVRDSAKMVDSANLSNADSAPNIAIVKNANFTQEATDFTPPILQDSVISRNFAEINAESTPKFMETQNPPQNQTDEVEAKDEFGDDFFDFATNAESAVDVNDSQNLSQNQTRDSADLSNADSAIRDGFQMPPLDLLAPPLAQKIDIDDSEIDIKVQNLFNKLRVFKIEGDIVRTYSGPVVTTFEFRPAPNVKVSRIQNLQDDLSMALKATSIRIQAPIPGKDVVGIEIPNNKIQTIYLREIFESDEYRNATANLPIALGKDVIGNPVIEDLAKLPHLLIAGTTGSGKSVGINAMILSLLYRHTPKDLRFIMIDPKFLEFGLYKDIPHLLTPIITDPKKAIIALSKAVEEMNRRYELMDKAKVKTIVGYNEVAEANGEEKLPYIVIIIDEFADLMIMGGREAEQFLISLAGKARASGIHLIIATQRPTVNVVTGLIKGNLPSKISYRVGSKIDSKVILDETGAEALLGRGDLLFSKTNNIVRLHAPYNDEREIERIVEFLKAQQEVQYDEFFSLEQKEPVGAPQPTQISSEGDYKERAKEIILQSGKTSISYLQRGLGVGFNKAASIIESLEKDGFLSPPNSKGVREIIGN
ncbi:DNA translocase FtsK [Helicobacter sp. 23-1045]